MLKKIYNYFLENIYDTDFLLQQKARVLLTLLITYGVVFSIYLVFFLTWKDLSPLISYPFYTGCIILILLLFFLRKGHFSLFAHLSVVIAMAMIWGVFFLDTGSIVQKIDTLVLIPAALVITPLAFQKKGKGILIYFAINMIVMVLAGIHLGSRYNLSSAQVHEFLLDNLTALLFSGFFCYQIFFVYRRALDNYLNKEEEIQAQYEELAASSEELEAMNDELVQTHQDLLDSNDGLRREKELMSTTLASIGDGVITVDINGNVLGLNEAAVSILDLEGNQKGKSVSSLIRFKADEKDQTIMDLLSLVFSHGEAVELDQNAIFVTPHGNQKFISSIITPLGDNPDHINGAVIAFRDISEKKKMEEELLKASKIESLGIFAGGIAHDFNNLLTAILGNISIVRLNLGDEDMNSSYLLDAEKASLRAKELTNQLLTFSRGGAPIKVASSLKNIIVDASTFILSGASVGIEFSIDNDLWNAEVDRGQISQVIQNLVLNARQVMNDGGVITIAAENIHLEKDSPVMGLKADRYIRVSVTDTGEGIPDSLKQKIFDPFFSTKKEGTGLGLAVTASIIKKHGGCISVESTAGMGTTFYFYLPATLQEPSGKRGKRKHRSFRGLRVLLMDDDVIVQKVGENMLKRLGCDVLVADDGERALEIYKREKDLDNPVDLVIVDLTVPGGMGGKETLQRLLDIDQSISAVVSSGYSNDQVMANYRSHGFASYIVKPYSIDEIEMAVVEAMEKKEN